MAEIKLYSGDEKGFIATVTEALKHVDQPWQTQSFYDTLKGTLVEKGIDLPGLSEGMKIVEAELGISATTEV